MLKTNEVYAHALKPGMAIKSASGRWLTVTMIRQVANRVIVIFDGDMEVDFVPYHRFHDVRIEGAR